MHSKSNVTKADIEMISRKIKDTCIQNWFTDIKKIIQTVLLWIF